MELDFFNYNEWKEERESRWSFVIVAIIGAGLSYMLLKWPKTGNEIGFVLGCWVAYGIILAGWLMRDKA